MGILEEYEYLWTTQREKHYLELIDNEYYIMDINNMMLIIEEDEVYDKVVEIMIENGVEIRKK